jgi:hypothetical protein
MPKVVLLKISKTGKGYRIASVPMKKLTKISKERQKWWQLEGDFLFLRTS